MLTHYLLQTNAKIDFILQLQHVFHQRFLMMKKKVISSQYLKPRRQTIFSLQKVSVYTISQSAISALKYFAGYYKANDT